MCVYIYFFFLDYAFMFKVFKKYVSKYLNYILS